MTSAPIHASQGSINKLSSKQKYNDEIQKRIVRYCDNYGIDMQLYKAGLLLIQMRSHIWNISPPVQERMRASFKIFSGLLRKEGVLSISQMTPEKILRAMHQLQKRAPRLTKSKREDAPLHYIRDTLFTVNNIFGCMPLLQWRPIEYLGFDNIRHDWTPPALPTRQDFYANERHERTSWLGRNYCIRNSGASPTLSSLGKEAISHLYVRELNGQWLKVYERGWKVFVKWMPHPDMDSLTQQDAQTFAQHLDLEVQAGRIHVAIAVAALNIVNDVQRRLRGADGWCIVEHVVSQADVQAVPHTLQHGIEPVKFLMQSSKVDFIGPKLTEPALRQQARNNYLLATTMRLAGQRIIKMRALNTAQGFDFNAQRSKNWLLWCDFASAHGVVHLCDVTLDLIKAYQAHMELLVAQTGISRAAADARLQLVMNMLGAIKPMQLTPSQVFADGQWLSQWQPGAIPSEEASEAMFQEMAPEELLRHQVWNSGLGNGLVTPLMLLASMRFGANADAIYASCAMTFAIGLKDAGLQNLEEVTDNVVDTFLDQLEDRVYDGLTTHSYAKHMLELINSVMPVVLPAWTERRISVLTDSKKSSVNHTVTTVDALFANYPKVKKKTSPR